MKTEQFQVYDMYTGLHYAGPFYSRRLAEQSCTKFPNSIVGTEEERQKVLPSMFSVYHTGGNSNVVFTITQSNVGVGDILAEPKVDGGAPAFEELSPDDTLDYLWLLHCAEVKKRLKLTGL